MNLLRQQHANIEHLKPSMRMQSTRKKMTRLTAFVTFAILLGASAVLSQEQNYTSSKVDYTIQLPSPTWRLVGEPDDVHQHTEFIYGDRNDGYLRIRKEALADGTSVRDFAHQDQDQRERFLPGYIPIGKEETFQGRLSGVTMSYEYTQAGKPMAGRTYYLQADNRVYLLRFTGMRDKLARIRNQTDMIARSFKLK